MNLIYAREAFPTKTKKSIFLAGPSLRAGDTNASWRTKAIDILERLGYDGDVFIPLPRSGSWEQRSPEGYTAQIEWEEQGLNQADCIVFWVPRDMQKLPALTTNVEFGMWYASGKIVFGAPTDAVKNDYLKYYANKQSVSVSESLEDTLKSAVNMIGAGALREGGECQVPLNIWNHRTFQAWLTQQKSAGNRLDGARVLWRFAVGKNVTFAYSIHVNVHIGCENRNKINEFVIARSDVAGIVCYKPNIDPMKTEVVLVKEFRSPARTTDGMIHEVPCGSSKNSEEETIALALHEVEEEVGFVPDSSKLLKIGSRQNSGTLSAHMSHVYGYVLSDTELTWIKDNSVGVPRGVEEDTERTYAEIFTVEELLVSNLVDWTTLGMIFQTLYKK